MRGYRLRNLTCLLAIVVSLCPTVYANSVINGDFETGDLTSWREAADVEGVAIVQFDVWGADGDTFAFDFFGSADGGRVNLASEWFQLDADNRYIIEWEQAIRNTGPSTIQEAGTLTVGITGKVLSRWHQGGVGAGNTTRQKETRIFSPPETDLYEMGFHFIRAERSFEGSILHMYVDNVLILVEPDMDFDGDLDFDDIDDFVLGLNDAAAYEQLFGKPPNVRGDIDGNGNHDFDDISGFVAILTAPSATGQRAIPEPSTLLLGAMATVGLLMRRRRWS